MGFIEATLTALFAIGLLLFWSWVHKRVEDDTKKYWIKCPHCGDTKKRLLEDEPRMVSCRECRKSFSQPSLPHEGHDQP